MQWSDPDAGVTTVRDHSVPRARLPTLTSLRFFAAALVVVVHLQDVWPNSVLQHGEVGVSFFYLLSGFILTWAPSTSDSRVRFYRRRFARIFPVHFLTWLPATARGLLLPNSQDSVVGVLLALFLLQAWVPSRAIAFSANGVAWSLSVEVLFYASFPFVLAALRRARPVVLWSIIGAMLTVTIVLALVVPVPEFVYLFPPSRFPEFMIGVALSLLMQSGWRPPVTFLPAAVIAIAAVSVDFFSGIDEQWTFAAVTAVPFALLIAAAAVSDEEARSRLAGRWWVRLGEWSFALFMTHQLVLRVYTSFVPSGPMRAVFVIPLLALCIGIAAAVFYGVERPLERRLRGSSRRQAPATLTT